MPKIDTIIQPLFVDSIHEKIENTSPTVIVLKDTIINQIQPYPQITEVGNDWDLNISIWLILLLTGLAVGVYFAIAFLRKYILPVFKTKYKTNKVNTFWYRITVIIWLLYGFTTLYLLLKSSVILAGLIIGITILLSFQFLYDFFIGIYYQFENKIRLKDLFTIGQIEGKIVSFNARHLTLENKNNEDVLIPYRNLLNQPITITKEDDNLSQKEFTIEIDGDIGSNMVKLNTIMDMCPWVYNSKHVKINHLNNNVYSIGIRANESFTFSKIENYLKSNI